MPQLCCLARQALFRASTTFSRTGVKAVSADCIFEPAHVSARYFSIFGIDGDAGCDLSRLRRTHLLHSAQLAKGCGPVAQSFAIAVGGSRIGLVLLAMQLRQASGGEGTPGSDDDLIAADPSPHPQSATAESLAAAGLAVVATYHNDNARTGPERYRNRSHSRQRKPGTFRQTVLVSG